MAKGEVVTRMLSVFTAIQGGRPHTAAELAAQLGVSTRTIFRDLSHLQTAGYPIYYDADKKTYRVTDTFQMRPLQVTSDEVSTLVAALNFMRRHEPARSRKRVDALMDKLLATLPQRQREEAGQLDRVIAVDPLGAQGVEDERIVRLLEQAVGQRRKVRMLYAAFTRGGEESTRVVRPYGLVFRGTSRYVIGLCQNRGEIRTFRVGRIKTLEVLQEGYDVPPDFDLETYLTGLWGITEGPETHVRLRFRPSVAQLALETRWHPSQQSEKQPDSSVVVTMITRGPAELSRWLAGYGGQVDVLAPDSLRQAVVALARGVLDTHPEG